MGRDVFIPGEGDKPGFWSSESVWTHDGKLDREAFRREHGHEPGTLRPAGIWHYGSHWEPLAQKDDAKPKPASPVAQPIQKGARKVTANGQPAGHIYVARTGRWRWLHGDRLVSLSPGASIDQVRSIIKRKLNAKTLEIEDAE